MYVNLISFNPYATETSILIIIYYNKLNWFRLVIQIHLFSMTSLELYAVLFSFFLVSHVSFIQYVFSVYDHFSIWKITLNDFWSS